MTALMNIQNLYKVTCLLEFRADCQTIVHSISFQLLHAFIPLEACTVLAITVDSEHHILSACTIMSAVSASSHAAGPEVDDVKPLGRVGGETEQGEGGEEESG